MRMKLVRGSKARAITEFLAGYYNGKGEKDRLLLSEYSNLRVDLVLSNDEQRADEIAVYSFLSDSKSSSYDESWRRYFLNDLLTRLGVPTDVWLGFGLNTQKDTNNAGVEDTPHFYELYVIYSELGVIVRYMGTATHGGSIARVHLLNNCKISTW